MGLGYGIARLARLIARDATRRVNEVLGLTLAEWRLLLLMHSDVENHLDALAERALLEKSHASVAATTLADKKLILRTVSTEDRRRVYFTRTAVGNRAVETYLAATTNERSQLWGTLTDVEQRALRNYIDRLLDTAEKRLGGSRSRKKVRSST
jgi:DNA-binding MarR family transcriptional regulator